MLQAVKNLIIPDNIIATLKDLIDTLKTAVPSKEFSELLDSIVHYVEVASYISHNSSRFH